MPFLSQITVTETASDICENFLNLMYKLNDELHLLKVVEVARLADKYEAEELLEACLYCVEDTINQQPFHDVTANANVEWNGLFGKLMALASKHSWHDVFLLLKMKLSHKLAGDKQIRDFLDEDVPRMLSLTPEEHQKVLTSTIAAFQDRLRKEKVEQTLLQSGVAQAKGEVQQMEQALKMQQKNYKALLSKYNRALEKIKKLGGQL